MLLFYIKRKPPRQKLHYKSLQRRSKQKKTKDNRSCFINCRQTPFFEILKKMNTITFNLLSINIFKYFLSKNILQQIINKKNEKKLYAYSSASPCFFCLEKTILIAQYIVKKIKRLQSTKKHKILKLGQNHLKFEVDQRYHCYSSLGM